jgi:hypothetical protein
MFVALMAVAIVLPEGFILVTFIATPIFIAIAVGLAVRESRRQRSSGFVDDDR